MAAVERVAGAVLFGFTRALGSRLQILQVSVGDFEIPSEFLQALPYVVTIIVVAGAVGRAVAPAADGVPYERSDEHRRLARAPGRAVEACTRAYAPYSSTRSAWRPGGRRPVLTACNVENASYGVTLCAECGLVSALHSTGGGRLVAVACVDGRGEPLVPCGRCRQLLHEHGGAELLFNQARWASCSPTRSDPSTSHRCSR